jgi:hypothetical protein
MHIFGVSFEKSEEGKYSAAMDAGEVFLTLNTKNLSEEFVITREVFSDKNFE